MKQDYLLMLEADAADREISSEYFKARNIAFEFLSYSHEVMAFLCRQQFEKKPLPKVIVLNLHSTPENGLFVLQELKDNDDFRHIPVVILGENTEKSLVKKCYENGANTFVNKPFSAEETDAKINAFLDYWFNTAETVARATA